MSWMRSITLKLTLAFLLVGLTGAGLVAMFVRERTQVAFNRLVLDQNQQTLVDFFAEYYAINGSWEGVQSAFRAEANEPPPPRESPPRWDARQALFTVVDTHGSIVFGGGPQSQGHTVSASVFKNGTPIVVNNQTAGWILFTPWLDRWRPGTPEGDFLTSVFNAIGVSALIATGVALLLGGLLATTMTRSLRELTAATKALAGGKLGSQVKVHSKDELGELAVSFNQMSTELARSNELRRRMTADIAHDLRTPLSVILGYSEALSDGKLEPSGEMFEVMHAEARHLSHLIDDFKVLALADAGEVPLALQRISPEDLLKRVGNAQRVRAEKQAITLETETPPDLPEIDIDVERMIQVLGNLVSNALRYTPPGGRITLSGRAVNGSVFLEVKDTGKGIAAEDLPFIFERSYRGDRARRQQDGEAGLGLAIAKSIVETHGGKISVESKLENGTTFTIELPAKKSA
jgi:two-component system sensor histidine kinase BaeS